MDTSDNHKNAIRNKIARYIAEAQTKFKTRNKNKKEKIGTLEREIQQDLLATKKFFRENQHLILMRADKAKAAVIIEKDVTIRQN